MHSQRFQRGYVPIFLSYYKPHMKLFILDMCCALGIALVDLAFPAASRQALNELLPKNLYAAFFAVMAILLAAYALRSVMYFIVTYWGHMMGVRIEADIRRDLFSHMQDLSFSFYDKNRTGQLMSRATTDLFEITELAHHGPEDLFISAVTLTGAFCMMMRIQWKLALVVFAVVPIFVGFTIIQRRRMMKASVRQKQTMAGINGQLESAISGMRTAKAFASEGQEEEKFRAANEQFKGAKRDYYKAMATYHAGLEFALPAMNVLTVAAGGLFIMRGEMDFVDLVTFTLYISTFLTPVRKLAAFVEQFLNGMAGFKRRTGRYPGGRRILPLRRRPGGAGPCVHPHPPGGDGGGGGPLRRRQVHPLPARPPVLRRDGRPHPGGRPGRAGGDPALPAPQHRHRPAGRVPVCGDDFGQYPLRQAGRGRGGGH